MINKEQFYRISDKLIRALYPEHCPVCDEIIPINEDYCKCSRQSSRKISDDYCRHCGQNIDSCSCKAENSFILPDVAGVYYYEGRVRADILNLKFNYRKHLSLRLASDMAERCARVYSDIDFDVVSFVPMSEDSYIKRGYNQSELLAKHIGKMFFIPTKSLLKKNKNTAAQHELTGTQRAKNLDGSFVINTNETVKGKKILLCDDVKTTGATLSHCVRILEEAGAERVCCICVAITNFLI